MNRINYKALLLDTHILFEEYKNENNAIYENLFNNLFEEKDKPNIISRRETIRLCDTSKIDVSVFVDRHTDSVECYFVFDFEIDNIIGELRENAIIRKLTKLCFFIKDHVGFYSSALDSNEKNDFEQNRSHY